MPQTNKYAFSGQKSGGRGLGTASAAEKARDGIPYRFPKSGFSPILAGIGAGKSVVITPEVDEIVVKSARNIPGVVTTTAKILSVYDIVNAGKFIVDKAALAVIEEVFA